MSDEQNVVSNGEVASVNPSESQASEQVTVSEQEKMLPQSKVNEIVGATKKSAYDKAYQDARSEFQTQTQNSDAEPSADSTPNVEELVGSKISEYFTGMYEAQQAELAKAEAQKTLSSLQVKVDEASKKYEDFEDVTKDIPYSSFPELLTAADSVDNAGDVLYHLGKNPSKFRELASALTPDNPLRSVAMKELNQLASSLKNNEIARSKELNQLASSLKNNEIARSKDLPRDPLSSIRPSNVGADSGKKSITELRKKYTV
jgi:hypothetical protein